MSIVVIFFSLQNIRKQLNQTLILTWWKGWGWLEIFQPLSHLANSRAAVYFNMFTSTPVNVITTGLMHPSLSKCNSSMQVTRELPSVSLSGLR
jgi:hypothetical protein